MINCLFRWALPILVMSVECAGLARAAEKPMSQENLISVLKKSNDAIKRVVLDNGMVCLVKEDHSAPVVSVQIWIRTGAIDEAENLGGGLSHYVEHMVFKGTPTRKVGDISGQINDVGGKINAYTSSDRVVMYTDMPSAHWATGVSVLADAVMNSTFPEDEWEREKKVILQEFAMGEDDPARVMHKLADRTAYKVHPYRVPVIGYENVFTQMSRKELLGFFKKHYTPDNMITIVVGDVNSSEVLEALGNVYKNFKPRPKTAVVLPSEPPQLARRTGRETGAYQVSRMRVMWHTVNLTHKDSPALDVLAAIVGHGRSSRLNQYLKEKKRLVHTVSAWSYTPKYPGTFAVSMMLDPDKEERVLAEVDALVESWATASWTEEELAKARRMVISNELSELQTMSGQAAGMGSGEFYTQNPRFGEVYIAQILAVTAEDISRVAKIYFSKRNSSVAVLAPEAPEQQEDMPAITVLASPTRLLKVDDRIRVVVREDHKLPFVYMTVVAGGGLLSETEKNNGITKLMASLLVRGTPSFSASEIAENVESRGGALVPFSGRNSFGLQARCLTDDAEYFMTLMAECFLQPTFTKPELAKQRDLQLTAIQQEQESPFTLARESLRQALFPGHPYSFGALGTESSVKKIREADLEAHHASLVVSENVVVSVFGDVTKQSAEALVSGAFKRLHHGKAPSMKHAAPKPELPARIERREPKSQAIYLIGFPSVSLYDEKKTDALTILQTAMSGLSSTLADEVREKRGLVYYSGAISIAGLDVGSYVMYAGTREDAVPELEKQFLAEIKRVTTGGLTQAEFDQASNRIVAGHHMSSQNNLELAMMCGLNELYGLGHDYSFSLENRVKALTLKDVQDVAAEILRAERQVITVVLPNAK